MREPVRPPPVLLRGNGGRPTKNRRDPQPANATATQTETLHHQQEPTRLRMARTTAERSSERRGYGGGAPPIQSIPLCFVPPSIDTAKLYIAFAGITAREIAAVEVTALERYIAAQVEHSITAAVRRCIAAGM